MALLMATANIPREEAREGVADSIPGKYQLAGDNRQCMACLFRQLVKLEGIAAGGIHLILMTRGGADSLSVSDEQVITTLLPPPPSAPSDRCGRRGEACHPLPESARRSATTAMRRGIFLSIASKKTGEVGKMLLLA